MPESLAELKEIEQQLRVRLGQVLREARQRAGLNTRQMKGFTSGHISPVERGQATFSDALIQAYIGIGADRRLVYSLVNRIREASRAVQQAKRRHGQLPPTPTPSASEQLTGDVIPDDIRRHYSIEMYDVYMRFDARGAVRQVRTNVSIRATSRGVRFYYAGHAGQGERRRGTLRFEAERGARLDKVVERETGAVDAYFRLDRELGPVDAEPYGLAYIVHVNSKVREDPEIIYVARTGSLQHTLRVQFVKPAVPEKIWWVGVPNESSVTVYPDPACLLPAEETGYYSYHFDRLQPGWLYGFCWIWSE